MTALSTLSTDLEEVLDRRLIMVCLRDALLGVKAGPVPDLVEETIMDSNLENSENTNLDSISSGQRESDEVTVNIVDGHNDERNESHGDQNVGKQA